MAKRKRPLFDRWLAHPLEAAAAFTLLSGLRLLSPDRASDVGAWLGRTIGPRLGLGRRAARNLKIAFPDMSDGEVERVLLGMWDNLGRVAGEYPHLVRICRPESGRIETCGLDNLEAIRDRGGFMVSAHIANWEVMGLAASHHMRQDFAGFVRNPNNPWIVPMVERLRGGDGGKRIQKGAQGAMEALRIIRRGGIVGMLIDQRLNDGMPVTFFGREAMTASVPAAVALRFGCPILPVRCERLGPARFRLTVLPALPLPGTGDREADVRTVMESFHRLLEEWIRARPSEWLWVHRRWPRAVYDEP